MIRSAAFNATRSVSVPVQIPVAVDPLALGKVADAFTAALFVKDAGQLLKGPAFHVTEPPVSVGDRLIDRAEIDGGNGAGQGGKPGAKKIVGQVITSAACLLGGKHRKPFLDELVATKFKTTSYYPRPRTGSSRSCVPSPATSPKLGGSSLLFTGAHRTTPAVSPAPRPRTRPCKLALTDYADRCMPMSYVVFRVCKRARRFCKLGSAHRQCH